MEDKYSVLDVALTEAKNGLAKLMTDLSARN